jgi:hypothetical protein
MLDLTTKVDGFRLLVIEADGIDIGCRMLMMIGDWWMPWRVPLTESSDKSKSRVPSMAHR